MEKTFYLPETKVAKGKKHDDSYDDSVVGRCATA